MLRNHLLILFRNLNKNRLFVLINITGLFTLVSLNIIKRMKEIGVRKVHGASVGNISRIINTQFMTILLIACVVGAFMGMSLSDLLMGSIWKHHQSPTWLTVIGSCIMLLVACILSVAVKTYHAAKMNPADVLRSE